jgi:hypothetical protein
MATPRINQPIETLTVSIRTASSMVGLSDPILRREAREGRLEMVQVCKKDLITVRSLKERFAPKSIPAA